MSVVFLCAIIAAPLAGYALSMRFIHLPLQKAARAARQRAEQLALECSPLYQEMLDRRHRREMEARAMRLQEDFRATPQYGGLAAPTLTGYVQVFPVFKPVPQLAAPVVVSEGEVQAPTMDEVLALLPYNSLKVCLGKSMTTGEPYSMHLVDGTHYEIIGGSGFGKSCYAAAILDMTTKTNDEDHLQIALLDLEDRTCKLFQDLPHVAELTVGHRRVAGVARTADEVADHLHWWKLELDRRKRLSLSDLKRERFVLIYVEEFLSLRLELEKERIESMAADFSILALRGRKYGLYLMACAQVQYADKLFRDALNQFNVKASFTVRPRAAQAVGFTSYDLLTQNFAAKQKGQLVLETTGCIDLMLAPHFDVEQKLLERERSQYGRVVPADRTASNVRVLNANRTVDAPVQNDDANGDERASELMRAVRYYKIKGWGKEATIKQVWNVTKGGSLRYQQAEEEYEQVAQDLEQEGR